MASSDGNSAGNMLRQFLGRIGDLSAAIDQQGSSVSRGRGTAPQFSTCKKNFSTGKKTLDRPKKILDPGEEISPGQNQFPYCGFASRLMEWYLGLLS